MEYSRILSRSEQRITVTELTKRIKDTLERTPMLTAVKIHGEASGVQCYQGRSTWFTVKDADAQISCVYWGILEIKNGDQVEVDGRIVVYPKSGRYQLNATRVVEAGAGEGKEAYEKLVKELEKKGYFDSRLKKPLPEFIRRIALVTSPDGAAIGDVHRVLQNRDVALDVELYGVSVQGKNAPPEVSEAIYRINALKEAPCVIVLTRGGGGAEDLVAFNDPMIFEAIHSSRIPVICAIGHERDVSIAEMCADVRCTTPTDAANKVADRSSKVGYHTKLLATFDELYRKVSDLIRRKEMDISKLQPIGPMDQVLTYESRLAVLGEKLHSSAERWLSRREHLLETLALRLEESSPFHILSKGYAIVYKDGNVADIKDTREGDQVEIVLKDARIGATVNTVSFEQKKN